VAAEARAERKSGAEGKGVELGGRRIVKKKTARAAAARVGEIEMAIVVLATEAVAAMAVVGV
jgi:hypothetical protein